MLKQKCRSEINELPRHEKVKQTCLQSTIAQLVMLRHSQAPE